MNRESPTERSRISFIMKVAFASLVLIAILGATFAQESYGDGYVGGSPYGRSSHERSYPREQSYPRREQSYPQQEQSYPRESNAKHGSGYHSGYPPCKLCDN